MTIFFLSGGRQIGPGVFENGPPLSIFPFINREKSRGEAYFVPPVQKKIVNRVLSSHYLESKVCGQDVEIIGTRLNLVKKILNL